MFTDNIQLQINGSIPAGPVRPTDRAFSVASLFGLSLESRKRLLFDDLSLTLSPGDVVLITGPSGGGKSTLLRRIADQLHRTDTLKITNLSEISLPNDRPVVDCFACPLSSALAHLSKAGLSEAEVLLRAPSELSEGQQFRFRLAQFFASDADVLIADEFGALLDRVTACITAWQLGKYIRNTAKTKHPRAALLATTHEDLDDDLQPTQRIWKGLGTDLEIRESVNR